MNDMCDNSIVNMAINNHCNRSECGRPSNEGKQRHINCATLKDQLRNDLMNHHMNRKRKRINEIMILLIIILLAVLRPIQ